MNSKVERIRNFEIIKNKTKLKLPNGGDRNSRSFYCYGLENRSVKKREGGIYLFGLANWFLLCHFLGGTLDVTVHKIQDDGRIKEIHKVTGGPHGGMYVNQQFESL